MYQIDKTTNNIVKLEERLFGDIGIREREHLQEWIAKNPEVLGEELLIIQKEYNGFNDTNERLDLLALDKDGNLVIIENKLDDSGRDVTWQALKYTSYCSTLTTSDVIRLYQKYLDIYEPNKSAKELLIDFLDTEENELLLNKNDQRIIFVANHYRKEVTSTVLWLINHDVKIQCFRATPFSKEEELFLNIEQIIPLPETEEFMINAKVKEKEEKAKSNQVEKTENLLVDFWNTLKENLSNNGLDYLESQNVHPRFYIGFPSGKGRFGFCIGRKTNRVELYFTNDSDKKLFDAMLSHRDEIESNFDGEIEWQRLDDKRASRIKFELSNDVIGGSFRDVTEENWRIRTDWFRESMVKFHAAVLPVWEKVQKDQ